MSDRFYAEFTGERVIPGRVEDNLFNEHLARYRFTARLVEDLGLTGAILDAGCGAGYGAAELARFGAPVLAVDISPEAIAHASANYAGHPELRFEQASCTAIPAADGAFRLITAFEVIEHLSDRREFLAEARRVLGPAGLFLVSTPNRLYYAESRQKAGPNPFHVHEFTEEEFRSELGSFFPHVKILLQNHIEGIALSGAETEDTALEISDRKDDPAGAHFFLAVCGQQPLPRLPRFIFIPETGNVLQTRERHIALLDDEIRTKNQWIETEKAAHLRMEQKVRTLELELEEHNQWARKANEEAERRAQLVARLQDELRKSNEWALSRDAEAVERAQRVEQLQAEVATLTAWALKEKAESEERANRVVELQAEVVGLGQASAVYEAAIEQWRRDKAASDQWAMETERRLSAERDDAREAFAGKQIEFEIAQQRIASQQAEMEQLRNQITLATARINMIAQSRWVKVGRTFRVGPEIERI